MMNILNTACVEQAYSWHRYAKSIIADDDKYIKILQTR